MTRKKKPRSAKSPADEDAVAGSVVELAGARFAVMSVGELRKSKADYNPRKISEHDYEQLRASIARFGVVENVVFNERTGNVVGGHQRIDAAEGSGLSELPVCLVDLSENEERALNVALNRISGEWDWGKLSAMLKELDDPELLKATGFAEHELEPLLQAEWGDNKSGANPEDFASDRKILLTADQAAVVMKGIEKLKQERSGLGDVSDGEALSLIVGEWVLGTSGAK